MTDDPTATFGPTATFEKVRDIIAEQTGTEPARISVDSDLARDLGVAGDDGDNLFAAFDKAFDVDWTGLNLGIHFGQEGFGPPLPWRLKGNCVMYEPQPCNVSDIVCAVETGRWPGTEAILLPPHRRALIYAGSILFFGFLGAIVVATIVALLWA